jgi:hypothetical protein
VDEVSRSRAQVHGSRGEDREGPVLRGNYRGRDNMISRTCRYRRPRNLAKVNHGAANPPSQIADRPLGFLVTIERRNRATGFREEHQFTSRVAHQCRAVTAATYKHGFIRILKIEPVRKVTA